jgi:hypothetical protein
LSYIKGRSGLSIIKSGAVRVRIADYYVYYYVLVYYYEQEYGVKTFGIRGGQQVKCN